MFENTAEKDLKERLAAAGAGYFTDGVLSVLAGHGLKPVADLGDGTFRVSVVRGFYKFPGSYAGIADSLKAASAACGYDAVLEDDSTDAAKYILTPRP